MVYYNIEILKSLLMNLSTLTKSNITLFDNDFSETKAASGKIVVFCDNIHQKLAPKCSETDKCALERSRANDEEGFYYHCHFGFIEIMIKAKLTDKISSYVCLGPFRDPATTSANKTTIRQFAKTFHLDEALLLSEYEKIPRFSLDKYESIKQMVHVILEYAKANKYIAIQENFFEKSLSPYMEEHLSEPLQINDLCAIFSLSLKKIYNTVRHATGLSPKSYLTKLRIEKAKEALLLTDQPLPKISESVGIEDYNYFIKVFKKSTGLTPMAFRKKGNDEPKK